MGNAELDLRRRTAVAASGQKDAVTLRRSHHRRQLAANRGGHSDPVRIATSAGCDLGDRELAASPAAGAGCRKLLGQRVVLT